MHLFPHEYLFYEMVRVHPRVVIPCERQGPLLTIRGTEVVLALRGNSDRTFSLVQL